MKGLKQAAARGAAWNLAQNLIGRILALAVVAVLGRVLAKSDFGAVAVGLAVTSLGELLATQGYGEFIAQRQDITDAHLDTAFWLNAGVGIVLTLVIVMCAHPLADLFGESSVAPILRYLSLSVLIRSVSVVPTGLLMRELAFRSLSLRSLLASVIAGSVGIVAAFSGLGIWSLVVQVLVGDFVAAAVLWRATEWRPGFRLSRSCLRELNAFGVPVLGAATLVFVSRRLDTVIIVGALGILTLATYSMAQRVFQIANQVLNKSGDAVTLSALARLAVDPDRRREAFYKIVELSAVLFFPIYAGLALTSEPLVVTLFSARWIESAPVLVVFAFAGIPMSLSYLHAAAFKGGGRARLFLFATMAFVALYLPLLLLLLDRGPTAAAIAYLVSCILVIPIELGMLKLSIGIRVTDYVRRLVGPLVATILMCGAILFVQTLSSRLVPPAELTVEGLVGIVAYLTALRLVSPGAFLRCTQLVRATLSRSPSSSEPPAV